MNEVVQSPAASLTAALLTYYGSEGTRLAVRVNLLARWLKRYPESWVRLALIESLYQGRYKTISVEQLLELWQRRGRPTCHFNGEFETLVCHNIPRDLTRFPHEPRDHGFSPKSPARRPETIPQVSQAAVATVASQADDVQSAEPPTVESWVDEETIAQQLEQNSPVAGETLQINEAVAILPEHKNIDAVQDTGKEELPDKSLGFVDASSGILGNLAIEAIHPFILEDEFDEFCEKLVAIAAKSS
jgi:hypothetical protein